MENKKREFSESISGRLKKAARGMTQGRDELLENDRRILRERARRLADGKTVEQKGAGFDYLCFTLSGEKFGIEQDQVKEVLQLKELTPLPCTPAFVAGIINVRGRIVAVLDIRRFFDLPAPAAEENSRGILLKKDDLEFALLAESIDGIYRAYNDEMQKTLPTLSGIKEEYIRGITNDRVLILDYNKLINDGRIIVNDHI